jgi:ribonuclease HI
MISKLSYMSHFVLMDSNTTMNIWKQIRRALGMKCNISNQGLTLKFSPFSLCPTIIDPYWKNISTLIASWNGEMNTSARASPASQRKIAIDVFRERLRLYLASDSMGDIFNDLNKFLVWKEGVGTKKAASNIYDIAIALETIDMPRKLLDEMEIYGGEAIYLLQRNMKHPIERKIKNHFIYYLWKTAPLKSKRSMMNKDVTPSCNLCGRERQTHQHLICDCVVSRWIMSNPFNSPLWPTSERDLLCCDRFLSKEEVIIRASIISSIYSYIVTHDNWSDLEDIMMHKMGKVLMDIEKSANAKYKRDETKVDRPLPAKGKYDTQMRFDGSANPKLLNGGYGVSISNGCKEIWAEGMKLGNKTINEAEAIALIRGLEAAVKLGIRKLTVYGDSMTVIRLGSCKAFCPSPKLYRYYVIIQLLLTQFDDVELLHTPREYNKRADVLAFTSCNAPEFIDEAIRNVNFVRPKNTVNHVFDYEALIPARTKGTYLMWPDPMEEDKKVVHGRKTTCEGRNVRKDVSKKEEASMIEKKLKSLKRKMNDAKYELIRKWKKE